MTAILARADALAIPLADESVDLVVTSPPYWAVRSYQDGGEHMDGQVGDETHPDEYIARLVAATAEMARVLKPGRSIFVNLNDKYSNRSRHTYYDGNGRSRGVTGANRRPTPHLPGKTLMGLPWRYAIAVMDQLGLLLRAEIIWHKVNGLPESVADRVWRGHETWFHFTKGERYYHALGEIREPYARDWGAADRNGRTGQDGWGRGDLIGHRDPHCGMQNSGAHPEGRRPGSVWPVPSEPFTLPIGLHHDDTDGGRIRHVGAVAHQIEVELRAGIDLPVVLRPVAKHYAAFPSEWPRRLVLGFSPPGICTACGEPREPIEGRLCEQCGEFISRQVKRCRSCGHVRDWKAGRETRPEMLATDWSTAGNGTPRHAGQHKNNSIEAGWGCACWTSASGQPDPATRPAVVLDTFGGTGTTAITADALGRVGLSFDLSWDYCRLAEWRRDNDTNTTARIRARTDRQETLALT